MKPIFFTILSIFLIISISNAQDTTANKNRGKGLLALPATVSFYLDRGQSGTNVVHISNNLSEKESFRLYLKDWMRDSIGSHAYYKAGTYKHSCANWVTLNKNAFELEPGQTEDITIKMQVPDTAKKEMKWTMLFCETVHPRSFGPLAPNKLRAGMTQEYALGIHIYETPPSLTDKSMKMLSFAKDPAKKNTYKIVCQNTGTTQLDVKCYLELSLIASDAKDKKIKIGPNHFPMFPDQKRVSEFTLPDNLAKGKYTVVAAVDGGSDVPLEAAQGVIEIK